MKRYILPVFVLIISWVTSCGQKTFDEHIQSLYKNTVPLIRPNALKEQVDNVILLDTRTPEEYQVSHLPGALLVADGTFYVRVMQDIPKDANVVVYCSVGYRSERVGEKLKAAGYTKVKNLYGGIFGWKNAGFEVVNKNNQPTDSVHTYNKSWGQWLYKGIKVYE